jgi:hypothetical protein
MVIHIKGSKMFYKFKEFLKSELANPGTYGSILLGATIVYFLGSSPMIVPIFLWFLLIQQLLIAGGRKDERTLIKKYKAYRDKVLNEKD